MTERERLIGEIMRGGAGELTVRELLIVILRTANEGDFIAKSAGHRADGLTRLPVARLGFRPESAAKVAAGLELGRRSYGRVDLPKMYDSKAVAEYLVTTYGAGSVERFGVLLLDGKSRMIRDMPLTTGTINASPVDPREMFREAVASNAAAIILYHNHPSGDTTPSPEDVKITDKAVAAGKVLGIDVLDHVILTHHGRYSFHDAGRL